nr:probable G-protein coupled receptor Mth-like 7 [Drosophila takahashii]
MCDEMVSLDESDYILEDESLILYNAKQIWHKGTYCLYPQFNSDVSNSIWVVKHNCLGYLMRGIFEIKAISVICNILTLFVYLYVSKLRNVLGKCLISTIFCWIILNLFYLLDTLNLLNRICLLVGYIRYFFGIVNQIWDCVISFHLWKLLTNRSESSSFGTYNAFAWGMAAIPTGAIYVMNLIWEEGLHKWNWLPLLGYSGCRLEAWGLSYWIYLEGPILILSLSNIIMFTLTVIHIWKVKSELRKFKRDEERTIQCFSFDTETYLMFLRISVIMGTIWILDFLYLLRKYTFIEQVYIFFMYIENGFGIIVFILLILKRSTLRLLMER